MSSDCQNLRKQMLSICEELEKTDVVMNILKHLKEISLKINNKEKSKEYSRKLRKVSEGNSDN